MDDFCSMSVSAHCIVTLKALTVTEENNKQCVFPIFPVIMFHSLSSSAGKPQNHYT